MYCFSIATKYDTNQAIYRALSYGCEFSIRFIPSVGTNYESDQIRAILLTIMNPLLVLRTLLTE